MNNTYLTLILPEGCAIANCLAFTNTAPMSYDQLFEIANALVLPGWLLLIAAPKWRWTSRIIISIIVTILAILYVCLIFGSISFGDFESFGSLEGIMGLFGERGAVLAGWIHYLAFDLMVGWFITFDAMRRGINRFMIIPCLLFTFMLGPSGLLLYLILRWVVTGGYFVDWGIGGKG